MCGTLSHVAKALRCGSERYHMSPAPFTLRVHEFALFHGLAAQPRAVFGFRPRVILMPILASLKVSTAAMQTARARRAGWLKLAPRRSAPDHTRIDLDLRM